MLSENVIYRMILGHAPYIRVEHISEIWFLASLKWILSSKERIDLLLHFLCEKRALFLCYKTNMEICNYH